MHKQTKRRQLSGGAKASLLAIALATLATPAVAATPDEQPQAPAAVPADRASIEDIIVTARRREESAQSTPVAVTAIGGQQLRDLASVRLSDIAQLAPSVKITTASGSANAPVIFIRGIGTITTAMYAEPAVGLYVDGVYMPRPTGNAFDLPDIERLEVLRGPQGTLFGRNTTGGALLITTQTPTDESGDRVELGYGSNSEMLVNAVLQTGLIGNTGFKAKFSGQIHNRDGWVNSPGFNRSDWGGNEKAANLGFALRGDVGDLTIDNRIRYSKVDSFTSWQIISGTPAALAVYGAQAAARPTTSPPFLVSATPLDLSYRDPRIPGNATIEGWGDVLTLDYRVSDALKIKSITSYNVLDEVLVGYLGGSYILGTVLNPAVPGNPVEPISVHATPYNPGHQTQFTQELQVAGDVGNFNYLAGLFYYDEDVRENVTTILASAVGANFIRVNKSVIYSQNTQSWAGFGQVGYKPAFLDGRLELSAGLRYTSDKKSEESTTIQTTTTTTTSSHAASNSWDNLGYSLSASFKFTPRVMLYGRVASSYRAGGFNNIALAAQPYDPEKAVSYEAGLKTEFFDRRLRLNAAIYQTDYDNLQVNQFINNGTTSTSFIANAAKASYKGFELEGAAVLGEHFSFDGNLSYIDPTYKSYLFVIAGVPTDIKSTAHFSYIPEWTFHVGGQVKTSETNYGQLTFRVDYSEKSSTDLASVDQFSPIIKNFRSGRDINLSARLIWSKIPVGNKLNLTAQAFVDNLTDQRYITFATDFTSLATAVFNRPRSVGVRLIGTF
ncbi:MAG: TonB-dependent receptor [Sphingomonadales bacterium]